MKQEITEEQFNELSEDKKEIWDKWMRDHHYTMKERFPFDYYKDKPEMIIGFPSIGHMIEFLSDYDVDLVLSNVIGEWDLSLGCCEDNGMIKKSEDDLVDTLWEATKEVLNK